MNPSYIELSYGQVTLAALLVLISGAISILLKLGLEGRLLLASLRMVVQLVLIGMVLEWVFAVSRWYIVVSLMLVMTVVAGVAAVQRTDRRYPGIWLNCVISMWASSWCVSAIALFGIIRADPWYLPQYAIPLVGMILGNTMSGIALGLDRLGAELTTHRGEVEALLAMGATRWEAAHQPIREAVRTGMIPTINSMVVAGIVSLPGMMTGQLLAGVDPIQAIKYQIVIFFLLASGTALGTVGVALSGYQRLFNSRHQFLHGLIVRRP
jgi:putative ABC transport system permease protein